MGRSWVSQGRVVTQLRMFYLIQQVTDKSSYLPALLFSLCFIISLLHNLVDFTYWHILAHTCSRSCCSSLTASAHSPSLTHRLPNRAYWTGTSRPRGGVTSTAPQGGAQHWGRGACSRFKYSCCSFSDVEKFNTRAAHVTRKVLSKTWIERRTDTREE